MKLIDPAILGAHMNHRDMTQSRLAQYAGCSRQFIYQLLKEDRKSCTPKLAEAIEDVLNVPRGALFVPNESQSKGRSIHSKGTVARTKVSA